MANPELGITRKVGQANELPKVNDLVSILKVVEFPKCDNLRLDTVYYCEYDKETKSPTYKSFFRDNISNLIAL